MGESFQFCEVSLILDKKNRGTVNKEPVSPIQRHIIKPKYLRSTLYAFNVGLKFLKLQFLVTIT
ncbi:MAG: hypothetical protein CK426_06020 [Legionella sp.]|nr:MAG: hypothetical protein CK423_02240 [Legionella sp.]PJD98452.1 MAG: hypothetical protein CK426_06020 [Legionella sp.]